LVKRDRQHIGRRVKRLDTVVSTNEHARVLASDPAQVGTVILAREQTAGRGQPGRRWYSPAGGGVWMSVILRPPAGLRRPVILTAWAAVALAEALDSLGGLIACIKWPNDVLAEGRKIAGILVEQSDAIVVGVGVNVNIDRKDFLAVGLPTATSLSVVTGRLFDVDMVAERLIDVLDAEYAALLTGGEAELETRWSRRVGLLDERVTIELIDGRRQSGRLTELTFAGVAWHGPDADRVVPERVRQLAGAEHTLGEAGDAVGGGGGE